MRESRARIISLLLPETPSLMANTTATTRSGLSRRTRLLSSPVSSPWPSIRAPTMASTGSSPMGAVWYARPSVTTSPTLSFTDPPPSFPSSLSAAACPHAQDHHRGDRCQEYANQESRRGCFSRGPDIHGLPRSDRRDGHG